MSVGYPDWQRASLYTDSPLVSLENHVIFGNSYFDAGIQDVSHFSNVQGYGYAGGPYNTPVEVLLTWYADPEGVVALATRYFTLTDNIGGCTFNIANQGPFLDIRLIDNVTTNATVDFYAAASNRQSPLEMTPPNPVLIQQASTTLPASTTVTVYPTGYYGGPALVTFNANVTSTVELLQYNTSGGTYLLAYIPAYSTNNAYQSILIMPGDAWLMTVQNNTTGAGAFNLGVIASMTGSG